jgi:hypothetical protein
VSDRTIAVKLSFPGETTTEGQAEVRDWSAFERFKRAAIGLSLAWVAAGVAIFLPILHFVLVPSLLLGGPIFAIFRGTEAARLKSLKGACPRCKVDRVFELGVRHLKKRTFTCDGCGNLIEIEEASGQAQPAAA